MHTKSRAIKSFITQFTTILLNEFPVAFNSLVFMRCSIELIHDLDTNTTHSTAATILKSKKHLIMVVMKLTNEEIQKIEKLLRDSSYAKYHKRLQIIYFRSKGKSYKEVTRNAFL